MFIAKTTLSDCAPAERHVLTIFRSYGRKMGGLLDSNHLAPPEQRTSETVWLRLTGREGLKDFIREEISGLLGNAIAWR